MGCGASAGASPKAPPQPHDQASPTTKVSAAGSAPAPAPQSVFAQTGSTAPPADAATAPAPPTATAPATASATATATEAAGTDQPWAPAPTPSPAPPTSAPLRGTPAAAAGPAATDEREEREEKEEREEERGSKKDTEKERQTSFPADTPANKSEPGNAALQDSLEKPLAISPSTQASTPPRPWTGKSERSEVELVDLFDEREESVDKAVITEIEAMMLDMNVALTGATPKGQAPKVQAALPVMPEHQSNGNIKGFSTDDEILMDNILGDLAPSTVPTTVA